MIKVIIIIYYIKHKDKILNNISMKIIYNKNNKLKHKEYN